MRVLATSILIFLFTITAFGQSKGEKKSESFSDEMEELFANSYYVLVLPTDDTIDLTKTDIGKLKKSWISVINVIKEEEAKELGYSKSGTLILVTLKKKRLEAYREMIKK